MNEQKRKKTGEPQKKRKAQRERERERGNIQNSNSFDTSHFIGSRVIQLNKSYGNKWQRSKSIDLSSSRNNFESFRVFFFICKENPIIGNGMFVFFFFDRFRLVFHSDTPLRSIIETPLTDSLVNGIFQQQNNVEWSNSINHFSHFLLRIGRIISSEQSIRRIISSWFRLD